MRNQRSRRRARSPKRPSQDDGLTAEERAAKREAERKRMAFLATINDSGKDLETRVKFASTVLCVPPPELRQLAYDSYEVDLEEARQKPLAVELLRCSQHCPQGNTAQRYDPNFGFRQALWEVAQRFEGGNLDLAAKLPLPKQKLLAAIVTESMVSENSILDLIFDLVDRLDQDPNFAFSRCALGILNGFELIGGIDSEEADEILPVLLTKLEAARDSAKSELEQTIIERNVAIVANIVMDGAGGEPPENPVAVRALSVLLAEEEAKREAARMAEIKRREAEAKAREAKLAANKPKKAKILDPEDFDSEDVVEISAPAPKAVVSKPQQKALTPVEVVKLLNVYDSNVSLEPVLEKISWDTFKKDAFVLNFLKKSEEDDGVALRCKLLVYAIGGFKSDSRTRFKKSKWLARKLFEDYEEIDDPDDEEELMIVGKVELGRTQIETLDIMFDKKLGSLQERTERAEPFIDSIVANPTSISGFFAGLDDRLEEQVTYFRQPAVQTVIHELTEIKPLGLTKTDMKLVEALRQKIWKAFAQVDEGTLKFPSDRSRDYFIECGETLLGLIAD